MSLADIGKGCAPIQVIAEIKGPETEEWYCPRIEWIKPDGTRSVSESDCAPFEKRHECQENQKGCGLIGFYWHPNLKKYVDVVKECPCTTSGYPRIWRFNVCAPPHPKGEPWSIQVRLIQADRLVVSQTIDFLVK